MAQSVIDPELSPVYDLFLNCIDDESCLSGADIDQLSHLSEGSEIDYFPSSLDIFGILPWDLYSCTVDPLVAPATEKGSQLQLQGLAQEQLQSETPLQLPAHPIFPFLDDGWGILKSFEPQTLDPTIANLGFPEDTNFTESQSNNQFPSIDNEGYTYTYGQSRQLIENEPCSNSFVEDFLQQLLPPNTPSEDLKMWDTFFSESEVDKQRVPRLCCGDEALAEEGLSQSGERNGDEMKLCHHGMMESMGFQS